jgi:hypothetical protein
MAVIGTKTAFGMVFTCTGGTAASAVIVPKNTSLRVVGVSFAGAATTDIVTISDADGNFFAKGMGSTGMNPNISFALPVRIDGIQVAMAGATTGIAVVYCV